MNGYDPRYPSAVLGGTPSYQSNYKYTDPNRIKAAELTCGIMAKMDLTAEDDVAVFKTIANEIFNFLEGK